MTNVVALFPVHNPVIKWPMIGPYFPDIQPEPEIIPNIFVASMREGDVLMDVYRWLDGRLSIYAADTGWDHTTYVSAISRDPKSRPYIAAMMVRAGPDVARTRAFKGI